jgi:uroporphyrinogen decarboxylase
VAYSGVLDDVRTCIRLGIPRQVPVFALGELFNARVTGITWADYTHHKDKLVACEIESVHRFDYDWVYLNPDDYIEFEPLGIKTKGGENIPLGAYEFLLPSESTLRKLRIPDFRRDGRMPAFLQAISEIKEKLGDTVCVTGRVAAPFTSVALLYGVEQALTLLVDKPECFRKTANFFVELMGEWGKAQIRAGADALWVGDCVASSGFISPAHYADFAVEGASKINAALRDAGGIVFYHAGESSLAHLSLMADTSPDALSVGGRINIREAKETLGSRMCLLGNIRGVETLQLGSLEEVEEETTRIMEAGKNGGGYIFNSEEGIPYQTPEENVAVMMQVARKHGSYA